jgi:hypothetical protein
VPRPSWLTARRAWWAGAIATAALASFGVWQVTSSPNPVTAGPPPLPAPVLSESAPPVPQKAYPVLDRSVPIKLHIPRIGLRAGIGSIGYAADGSIATPPYDKANRAMWFEPGPAPGQKGASVILGHVDTKESVAVFFYLTRVRPGDTVEVTREDRTVAVFTVSAIAEYPKTEFPSNLVYGDTPGAELRLITCGGTWDKERHHYRDNIVVYARMTSSHPE